MLLPLGLQVVLSSCSSSPSIGAWLADGTFFNGSDVLHVFGGIDRSTDAGAASVTPLQAPHGGAYSLTETRSLLGSMDLLPTRDGGDVACQGSINTMEIVVLEDHAAADALALAKKWVATVPLDSDGRVWDSSNQQYVRYAVVVGVLSVSVSVLRLLLLLLLLLLLYCFSQCYCLSLSLSFPLFLSPPQLSLSCSLSPFPPPLARSHPHTPPHTPASLARGYAIGTTSRSKVHGRAQRNGCSWHASTQRTLGIAACLQHQSTASSAPRTKVPTPSHQHHPARQHFVHSSPWRWCHGPPLPGPKHPIRALTSR